MIVVCSLQEAPRQIEIHGARHAVGILSPDTAHPEFRTIAGEQHLRLSFHDIAAATPGLSAPGSQDMVKLLGFLRNWDASTPLLIHCWAGISRSTAAGYITTCLRNPNASETELAENLRAASPSATPNPMLVALADEAMGREGRMINAIHRIGRGKNAFEGTPFILHP